ncbi:MAG: aldo/keto reductase [Nocardiopsaceae bacterium]|nr:aldo/keto reductase [Nocardiopsaceae bacterium]
MGALADRTVARIGYGAMQLGRLSTDPAAADRVLRHALEHGVNHIDTAQFYGNGFVNDALRQALPADGNVLVATKVGATASPGGPVSLRPAQRPDELRTEVEYNLRGLGRQRLDLVYLRRLDAGPGLRASGDQDVPLDDQLATLTAMRDEGKIAAIGLSGTTLEFLRAALPAGIAAVQNSYSLISREDEDMLRLCQAERIAWVPFFPLGGASPERPKVAENPSVQRIATELGATPAQVGLAWLLGHSPNILLVPGTTSTSHLNENLAAGNLVCHRPTSWGCLSGFP